MSRRPAGTVHLVGAGPGDPRLLTLRGAECLAGADVVISDALVSEAILRAVGPGAEVIRADRRGRRLGQTAINTLMIARARRGLCVVRLKGGDPNLFGRGGEEAEALAKARVRFEVVPGVTAALGAAATAGIPLTHRLLASSVTFATGHSGKHASAPPTSREAMAGAGTPVVYMTVGRLGSIVRAPCTSGPLAQGGCLQVRAKCSRRARRCRAPLGSGPGGDCS